MKNAIVIILFCLPLFSFSQTKAEFELTPSGFVNKADHSLDYIVLDYQGTAKQELFKKTLKYLNKQFDSPKDALSVIENESITINAIDGRVPVQGYSGSFNLNYSLTIEFKDDKLRIIAPSINAIYGFPVRDRINIGLIGNGFNKTIYSENGKIKLEKTKQVLELIFKAWIVKIRTAVENQQGDW